jgi:hypothetical protein
MYLRQVILNFVKIIYFIGIYIGLANASDQELVKPSSFPIVFKQPPQINIEEYPEVDIKIGGEKKSLNCTLDKKSKIYICPNGKEPILVKYGFSGFVGIGRDDAGSPKSLFITSVESANKTIFEFPKPTLYVGGDDPLSPQNSRTDLIQEFSKKVTTVEQFFMDIKYGPSGIKEVHRSQGSEEFERIAKPYIDEMRDFQESYNKIKKENTYTVELSDGTKVKCQRSQSRQLSPEEVKYEQKADLLIQCSSFKCDDIEKNGKKFKALLIFDSNPGNMISSNLHLFDDSGLGPDAVIKSISSGLSPIPLEDNSFFINHPKAGDNQNSLDLKYILPQQLRQNGNSISLYKDPLFIQLIDYQKDICSKTNALDDFVKAKDKTLAVLAEAELVQYIELLKDGTLRSHFVNPVEAPKLGCLYKGVYLNPDAAKKIGIINKNLFPDNQVEQTITIEKANALFKKATEMEDIAWKYKQDGCYARAHLMARRFEAEGVRVDKVWIKGDLYIPDTEPLIKWNFHVAPLVYVKNANGEIQKMVIDPSLFDEPVTVEEWDDKMSKNTIRGSIVTGFPFPENSAFMERSSISFSSSGPYLPNEEAGLSEEQKIKMANETMREYKQLEQE